LVHKLLVGLVTCPAKATAGEKQDKTIRQQIAGSKAGKLQIELSTMLKLCIHAHVILSNAA